jgi:putative inorganic carbon (HCO3(-)) transporter
MPQKIYKLILTAGIYLSFLVIFFTFKQLLFPYISSKQISFNMLMEILFIFWAGLIIKYPAWRPKKSFITFGLLVFFGITLITCFTGIDFNLSFWGDVERMLGVFHLLHFLILYLLIITVMRSWQDWKYFLIFILVVADLVSVYGIGQKFSIFYSPYGEGRIISTIGNAAYVGAFALFYIYFALILYFKEKKAGAKTFYAISIIINFFALLYSGTRGAYLGFAASLLIFFFLFAILNQDKKIKRIIIACSILFILLMAFFAVNSNKPWVLNNPTLSRLFHYSMSDVTMNTRFLSWQSAWLDFPNHPLLGNGYGNYAATFDKYFNPKFYAYSAGETYFDRAHNNIIDIVSTTGAIGLLAYFSIFAAAFYYLIKGRRQGKIELGDFILLISLIVAYFIQNLVVFDALVTYMALMVMLGYIYWLSNQENTGKEDKDEKIINKEIFVLIIAGLIMLFAVYQYNIKPLKMLAGTIDGQRYLASGDLIKVMEIYKKALSYKTVLDRDSRTTFIRSIAQAQGQLAGIERARANEIFDYAIELARENNKYNEEDTMNQLVLAQAANAAANVNMDNKEKFNYYSAIALEAIDKSIAVSPGRATNYFLKAQIFLTRGEKDKAIDLLKYAAGMEEKFYESHCYLGRVLISYNITEEGFREMDKCIDYGGANSIYPADYVRQLASHYIEKKDWPKTLSLLIALTIQEPQNAKNYIELAKLYQLLGDKDNAIKSAQKVIEIDKSLEGSAQKFINSLK